MFVPKRNQPIKRTSFNLIRLVTSFYKIIAEVLIGRIQQTFMRPFIFHKELHGGRGGEGILDLVLIANEVVDEKE